MNIKRPIFLFLSSFIVGIIFVEETIPLGIKIILCSIAVFLYGKLFIERKINKKTILIIILWFIIGIARLFIEEYYFENIEKNIKSLGYGNKVITANIESIGRSTNSNYYILSNCTSGDKFLGKSRCYFSDEIKVDAKIGNSIKINAGTQILESPSNEGEFNQKNYYRSSGIGFICFAKEIEIIDNKKNYIKQKIYEIKIIIQEKIYSIFNEKDAGLFIAMLTGDKTKIDATQKKLFSDNGIAHILAISGLHLSILGLALFSFLRKKLSIKKSALIVSIFILLYGIFIDAKASSIRAIVMLYIRFLSLTIGRSYDTLNSLYVIGFLSLLKSPYLLFDSGFQFSYIAIYALNQNVYIDCNDKLSEDKKENKMIPAIIILNLFLFPITVYNYYTYPTFSILINLIVIPLMPFVIGFGIIGLIASFIFIPLGKLIVFVVHIIFFIYEFLCDAINKLPLSLLYIGRPNLYEILYFYIALFILIFALKNRNSNIQIFDKFIKNKFPSNNKINFKIFLSIFLLILSFLIVGVREKSNFRITFLSIGQGDSILIENNDNIISVDGGSSSNKSAGQYILTPHLKSRGIKNISYAFLSHSDSDHINGIEYILENEEDIEIKNIILPINGKTDEKFAKIKTFANKRNTKIEYAKKGDEYIINDEMKITIISPDAEIINNKKMDSNELSLTFRLDYKNKSLLFTGDIGKKTINNLLQYENANEILDVDILKVPHHGSKNSHNEEFAKIISPEISVFSYGKNNSYGHPHSIIIELMENLNSKIYKTGSDGQIDIFIDEKENVLSKTYY